jgi:hypothetical protein
VHKPARTARSASSWCATGAPNTANHRPSPTNFATGPPWPSPAGAARDRGGAGRARLRGRLLPSRGEGHQVPEEHRDDLAFYAEHSGRSLAHGSRARSAEPELARGAPYRSSGTWPRTEFRRDGALSCRSRTNDNEGKSLGPFAGSQRGLPRDPVVRPTEGGAARSPQRAINTPEDSPADPNQHRLHRRATQESIARRRRRQPAGLTGAGTLTDSVSE